MADRLEVFPRIRSLALGPKVRGSASTGRTTGLVTSPSGRLPHARDQTELLDLLTVWMRSIPPAERGRSRSISPAQNLYGCQVGSFHASFHNAQRCRPGGTRIAVVQRSSRRSRFR